MFGLRKRNNDVTKNIISVVPEIPVIKVGIDLGNKNNNVIAKNTRKGFSANFNEISKDKYETTGINEDNYLVEYEGRYFIIGNLGEKGIETENRGDKEIRYYSNMFKLVALSEVLSNENINKGYFDAVTGCPYDHLEKYFDDYKKLFLSEDYEKITVNRKKYEMKVKRLRIMRQATPIFLGLKNKKNPITLIHDFGGGTYDLAYYVDGVLKNGATIPFSLLRTMVDLGKELNKYIDVDDIDINNAIFQSSMESLILNGEYNGIKEIETKQGKIALSKFVDEFLIPRVDEEINKGLYRLKISNSKLNIIHNVFAGGGAILLKNQLNNNKKLKGKEFVNNSQDVNAEAYYNVAKVLGDNLWTTKK